MRKCSRDIAGTLDNNAALDARIVALTGSSPSAGIQFTVPPKVDTTRNDWHLQNAINTKDFVTFFRPGHFIVSD